MLTMKSSRRTQVRGFTLIELMVAMTIGLIVIGATLALVLAIINSNNQTIRATRLTQELRATSAVITSDLKRARGVLDPWSAAKLGNPYKVITATEGCLRYGYANAAGGNFHAISWSAGGPVRLDADDVAANATCGAGESLSSDSVVIDSLKFSETPPGNVSVIGPVTGRQIIVTLTGHLLSDAAIKRTYSQAVFVRSVGN